MAAFSPFQRLVTLVASYVGGEVIQELPTVGHAATRVPLRALPTVLPGADRSSHGRPYRPNRKAQRAAKARRGRFG